jgi:hypothetical protein
MGFGFTAFFLGYIGFEKSFLAAGDPKSPLDLAYLSLQLFILESGTGRVIPVGWEIQVARILAPLCAFYTGLSFLSLLFITQLHELSLRFTRDHVIIGGMGLLGPVLAQGFCDSGHRVVMIEKDPMNENIEICREYGACVVIGDATHPYFLKKANVKKAAYLLAVLGEDGLNAEVASQAFQIVKKNPEGLLSCFIHIVDPDLFRFLKKREIGNPKQIRLEYINIYQTAGQHILEEHPPFSADSDVSPHVHLLVIGVGRMGEYVIAHAGKRWWGAYRKTGKKMKITTIDLDLRRKEQLLLRYPSLGKYCDLDHFPMDVRSPEFLRGNFLRDAEGDHRITSIYICIGDDKLGFSTALILHHLLNDPAIPIIVRTNNDQGITSLFRNDKDENSNHYSNIHVFPLIGNNNQMDFILKSTHERIAMAIHQYYLRDNQNQNPAEYPSMSEWAKLDETYKEDNRKLSDRYIELLRAVNLDIDTLFDWDEPSFHFSNEETEIMAKMEHQRWMAEKLAIGYKWGAKRDDNRKTHPSIKEWDLLTDEEKNKNRDIINHIPGVLNHVDLKIVRQNTSES